MFHFSVFDPKIKESKIPRKRKRSGGLFESASAPSDDGADDGECKVCDGSVANRHPAEFLTDLHNPNNVTCWQSDLMKVDGETGNVSLTISLRKKYELTYISLHFCRSKPHSMALYKSMDHGKSWQPFQFYSKDCKAVYNR